MGPDEDADGIVSRWGPVEIDWPKSIGFYGGLVVAVAFDVVAPPLAIFIGIYPLLKLLDRPKAPLPVRIISDVLQGAAKPVGGDAEGTIRVTSQESPVPGVGPTPSSMRGGKAKPALPAAPAKPRRRTAAKPRGARRPDA